MTYLKSFQGLMTSQELNILRKSGVGGVLRVTMNKAPLASELIINYSYEIIRTFRMCALGFQKYFKQF